MTCFPLLSWMPHCRPSSARGVCHEKSQLPPRADQASWPGDGRARDRLNLEGNVLIRSSTPGGQGCRSKLPGSFTLWSNKQLYSFLLPHHPNSWRHSAVSIDTLGLGDAVGMKRLSPGLGLHMQGWGGFPCPQQGKAFWPLLWGDAPDQILGWTSALN
jgi:hypothetical protein